MRKQSEYFFLMNLLKNWKKPIIIIGAAFTLCLILLAGGLGYAAFSMGSALWNKGAEVAKAVAGSGRVSELGVPQIISELDTPIVTLSKVQEFGLELGKGWLLQQASAGHFRTISEGISCLQSAGGPSHEQVTAYLAPLLSDQVRSDMGKTLEERTKSDAGWGSCVSLILPSQG